MNKNQSAHPHELKFVKKLLKIIYEMTYSLTGSIPTPMGTENKKY